MSSAMLKPLAVTPRGTLYLRALVVAILAATAAALGSASYLLFRRAELLVFETQFAASAALLGQTLNASLAAKRAAAVAMASSVSALGAGAGWRYPNATVPGYASLAASQLANAPGANLISFLLIVSAAQRPGFEAYALASVPLLGASANASRTIGGIVALYGVHEFAADGGAFVRTNDTARPWTAVNWQVAPLAGYETTILFDIHALPNSAHVIEHVLSTAAPAVTNLLVLADDAQGQVDGAQQASRAAGALYAPVFDASGTDIVGLIALEFAWEAALTAALPAFLTGVDVVLTSRPESAAEAARTYTFRVAGGAVADAGEGSLQEPWAGGRQAFTFDVDAGLGTSFQAVIYPTQGLYNTYLTRNPVYACAGVVSAIVAVALVFRLYDALLAHQHTALQADASAAHRIVDTVFPATVQPRLFRHHSMMGIAPTRGDASPRASMATPEHSRRRSSYDAAAAGLSRLMRRLSGGGGGGGSGAPVRRDSMRLGAAGMPIADRFADCTVLFTDLVNFTAWAAPLDATRVFAVLEAVWCEFDAAARACGVFKVETIGDCYMCVTGLPEPDDDHAAAMADFALQLEERLAAACDSLGLEPGTLAVRTGMHSGSVTAGVLRAERSRFQLFGDTVNTASRMESTGETGRIQVSAAAEELLRAGGRHTLRYRGKVAAKGKGELDTFWLEAAGAAEGAPADAMC